MEIPIKEGEIMTLNKAIQEILNKFSAGDLFDSHTVIEELITNREYYLAYLKNALKTVV